MAKNEFWAQDKPAAADEFWSADKPAAQGDLPAGVTPSSAGAGRGSVNPQPQPQPNVSKAQTTVQQEPAGDASGASDGSAIMAAAKPERSSVLEGLQMPDLPFNSVEAVRLSSRAYAEATPIPGSPRRAQSEMRASQGPAAPSLATERGQALQDAPLPVRATFKALSGAAQGAGGLMRAAGDLTGSSALSRAGRETTKGASEFESGMGEQGSVDGFGPKSPLPYLSNMAEGAASSLGQSAAYASMFGAKAVIPLMSVMTAGQEYDKARTAGLSPSEALAGAVPKGAFEAIGEKFTGLDKVAGAMGTLLTKGVSAQARQQAAQTLINSGIKEIPGEVVTYLGQTATDLLPGIGLNQNLTMGQFVDGLRDTVVQAGMMGGAMSGSGALVRSDPRIKRLRDTGETAAADLLQSRLDVQNAAATVDNELSGMTPLADFVAKPAFQADYRAMRVEGIKPVEAAGRSAITSSFKDMANMTGMSEKAINAVMEGAKKIGLDKLPGFLQRYTQSLASKGLIQPVEGAEAMAGQFEQTRDHAMNAAMGVTLPNDGQIRSAMDDVQGLENAKNKPAVAATPQAQAFDPGNDIAVTHETDAVHAAATSPLNNLPEPTEAQKKAGNYSLGRMRIAGMDIAIENPQGSVRRGTDADGTPWESQMRHHYGYFNGTMANDGDKLDVFVAPGTPHDYKGPVYVVDQIDPKTGKLDEHKVIIGPKTEEDARAMYQSNYDADWQGLGAITRLPLPAFKAWAKSGTLNEPLGDLNPEALNVQDRAPRTDAQTQTQAAPTQAPAPAGKPGVGEAATGTPAGASAVQADGVAALTPTPADQSLAVLENSKLIAEKPVAPMHLGRDNTPLAEGGKPFKSKLLADTARKLQPMMRVVRVDGGFALTEKTPAQLAAQDKAARRLSNPQTSPKGEAIPAHAMIAAIGGLAPFERADMGIEGNVRIGNRNLFAGAGKGITIEHATEKLIEDGYLLDASGHDQARALIKRSLTHPQYTAEGTERMAEADKQTRFEAAMSEEDAVAEIESVSDNQWAALDDAGIPNAGTPSNMTEAQAMKAMGFTDKEIADAITQQPGVQSSDRQSSGSPVAPDARAAQGGDGQRARTPPEDSSSRSPARRQEPLVRTASTQTPSTEGVSTSAPDKADGSVKLTAREAAQAGQKMREAEKKAKQALARAKPITSGLKIGIMATNAEAVSVNDGAVFIGKYAAQNFDTGEDVTVPDGATDQQIVTALKDAGALTQRQRVFGLVKDDSDGLIAPSEEQVLAQQDRKDNAAALDQREQIDKEASQQKLEQSIAPEQRRDTSGDMFAMEKATAEIDKRNAGATTKADPNQGGMFDDPAPAEAATKILDAADIKGKDRLEALRDVRAGLITPEELKSAYPAAEKINDVGEKIGGARKDTATSTGVRSSVVKERDDRETWAKRFKVEQIAGGFDMSVKGVDIAGKWTISDTRNKDRFDQPRQVGGYFDSKEEAEAALPLLAVAQKHRVITTSKGEDGEYRYEIWRDVSERKRVKVVDKVFDARTDAMEYMAKNAKVILETSTTFGEADLPKPESTSRTGVERRTSDVKGEDFQAAFGFRGVEFGNWNNQAERQEVMNAAYDGLMDLADVLGVPPKAIGLNGDLALAFGARGQGLSSARAHYERSRAVMNLTKMNGAGALAHEWFHALDHYLGRQDGKSSAQWKINPDGTRSFDVKGAEADMASGGFKLRDSGVRQELRDAYTKLVQSLFYKAEQYVDDTAKADKFVATTRGELETKLKALRQDLSEQKDVRYYKRNNKPASAENLAEFDALAAEFVEGRGLSTEWKSFPGKSRLSIQSRHTNDALEKMSAIYKEVRGRSGFDATNRNGVMDTLRQHISRYEQRLKLLTDANSATSKTKSVPTNFAMDAKSMDQGRGSDYWTTPHEMVARAFQGYVEDMISAEGGKSPFLNHAPENSAIVTPWGLKRPYPSGDERKAMNTEFDKFVGALQTKETDQGVAMFARQTSDEAFSRMFSPPTVMTITEVQKAVNALSGKWKSGPLLKVVATPSDLPIDAPADARGLIYNGTAYVVASNHMNRDGVAQTLAHEVIGHYGLWRMLGEDGKKQFERNLQLAIKSGNVPLGKLSRKVREMYVDETGRFNLTPSEEASEIAAFAVEDAVDPATGEFKPGYGFMKQVWAKIADFLRSLGIDVKFTNAELHGMLVSAMHELEVGHKLDSGAPNRNIFYARDAGRLGQTQTPAFKAWYGDWQNAGDDQTRPDSGIAAEPAANHRGVDAGGEHDVDALQRRSRMVASHSEPATVGQVLFTGTSGPVGEDGKPVVFFHGTREDISVFRIGHVGRLDKGWLGSGIYTTSSSDLAELYAAQKRGSGHQNIMPLYVAVRNPFVATNALKIKLKNASQEAIDKFTDSLKALGHDGVVMSIVEGHVELVAFEPTQVKSATGNNGDFDTTNPNIHQDLSRLGAKMASMGYEAGSVPRLHAAQKLASLVKRLEDGKINEAYFAIAVKDLSLDMADVVDAKSANRLMTERQRGADLVREKLIRARRHGDIASETVEFALWALAQNPSLAENLGISIRAPKDGTAAADYNPAAEIMRLFKGKGEHDSAVHEILHHAERMMPPEMQTAIRKEWAATLAKAIKNATPEQQTALENIPGSLAGDQSAYKALVKAIQEGPLNYAEHYQLVNPSEFWAVNGSRILANKFLSKDSIWLKVRDWLRNMTQTVKGLLGLRSDAAIIKALRNVTDPENFGTDRAGRFVTDEMLSNTKGMTADGVMQNIRNSAQNSLFQPTVWSTPDATRTDKIIYELQDGKVDLKRVQEAITKSGQDIEEKWDARLAETLYPGRVAYRSQAFLDAEAKPLLEAMARSKVPMDELADYLHARGAEERNVQIAKVNPNMPDGGAGTNTKGELMTTQNARNYVAAIPALRKSLLNSLAAKVDAITAGTRSLLVTEGLEKQNTVDAWTAAYKNYVPMFRDEAEFGFPPHPQGSGFTVKGGASKRATGSTKEVTNILAHVLMQREAAITRAEKNRVALALYGQALSHPNPDFWTTIRPGMDAAQIGAELQAMGIDPMTAEVGMAGVPTIRTIDPNTGKVVDRPNPMYRDLPGAIPLKVNGEDRVLLLNVKHERGQRLAESLKNLDGLTQLDLANTIIGKSTRWLAAVNTQYNPAFGLVNLTRDVLEGAINIGSTELRGNATVVLAQVPLALQGIARELATGNGGKWGTLYKQFVADGGQTGFKENFRDPNDRADKLEKELARMSTAGKLTPGHAAHAALDLLDGFNTTLENGVRLSAYKVALDKGISRAKAARLARELTVDFNRKGRLGRELGPLYAFFNASVQGAERALRTLRGPTGGRILAGGLALGVIQAMMLAAAGYDDDEIPEFVKTRAFVIPLNWSGKGEKKHILIPLPLGFLMVPNTGRVITELTLNGGKDIGKRTVEAIGTIAGSFNPLGGGNIFTMDGALKTLAPTLVDPLIELGFNKNFAGGKIEKEGYGGETDGRPGVARTKESTMRSTTGQAYMAISAAINKLAGGNDYQAGMSSPTPERVRYIAQTVGGGVLREIEKTINASTAAARGDKVASSQIPVLGRFYGEVDDDQVQMSRYFEQSKKLKTVNSQLQAAKQAGDGDAMLRILNDHPEIAFAKAQAKVQAEISKLNKLAVSTVKDPATTKLVDEARVAQMRGLTTAMEELERANGKVTLGDRLKPKKAVTVALTQ